VSPKEFKTAAHGAADWRKKLRTGLVVLGIWIALGVAMGLQIYANNYSEGRLTLKEALNYAVRRYSVYALLTIPIVWLCRRYPLPSKQWEKSVAAHLGGLIGFIFAYTGLRLLVFPPLEVHTLKVLPVTLETTWALLRSNIFDHFWMYSSIVVVTLAYQYHARLRERELREMQMRRQMAEYELEILKLQLHPHFLFNTLNGISTLMARDVKTAREMLVRLGDLLRIALSHTHDKEVSLKEEMEFVQAYLDLEQMRFGERLKVKLNIHPDTLDARVPNMILQPLVENAIRHGVAVVRSGGTIELETSLVNGLLRIGLTNDGPPGNGAEARGGSGLGLGNTRARLWQLYGDTYQLSISNRQEGGVQLLLEIPFRVFTDSQVTT
jgi:two-component system, LytTR family, sensor kinase